MQECIFTIADLADASKSMEPDSASAEPYAALTWTRRKLLSKCFLDLPGQASKYYGSAQFRHEFFDVHR